MASIASAEPAALSAALAAALMHAAVRLQVLCCVQRLLAMHLLLLQLILHVVQPGLKQPAAFMLLP
jgi:hypothetical protein